MFLPQPLARAAALKRICARHGLTGISPLDALPDEPADWAALSEAQRIALRNEAHIRRSDALIANLTPFRGPSADVGTVFEVGFMRALGRPVFGWSNDGRDFAARTRSAVGVADTAGCDPDGLTIEEFGLIDNLMIDCAIGASGGLLVRVALSGDDRWRDLTAFEACVEAAARGLG